LQTNENTSWRKEYKYEGKERKGRKGQKGEGGERTER